MQLSLRFYSKFHFIIKKYLQNSTINSSLYKYYYLIIPSFQSEPKGRYTEGEVNIHYKSPIRREEKENIPEEELRKRQVCVRLLHFTLQ